MDHTSIKNTKTTTGVELMGEGDLDGALFEASSARVERSLRFQKRPWVVGFNGLLSGKGALEWSLEGFCWNVSRRCPLLAVFVEDFETVFWPLFWGKQADLFLQEVMVWVEFLLEGFY